MDRTTRQKVRKEIEGLDNTINQLKLTHIYRTLIKNSTITILFK